MPFKSVSIDKPMIASKVGTNLNSSLVWLLKILCYRELFHVGLGLSVDSLWFLGSFLSRFLSSSFPVQFLGKCISPSQLASQHSHAADSL